MFRVNLKVATVKTRKKNLKRNWHGICEPTIIFHVLGKIFVEIGTVSAAKIVKGYEDNFGAAELPILPPPPPPQLLANKLSADSRSTAVSTCFFFFSVWSRRYILHGSALIAVGGVDGDGGEAGRSLPHLVIASRHPSKACYVR